ncbi:MAG: SixA phosphatase family protein [Myxococcota bacterium]
MTKRTLLLLRHAKSSWDDPALEDRERPLAPRGQRAARALGAHLARRGLAIDRVLCSTSRRTRETLALLGLDPATPAAFEEELYVASAQTLLRRLCRLPAKAHCVLVIGHDPGLDQLTQLLTGGGRPKALRRLAQGFKTGALAELSLSGGWRGLRPGTARLERFTRPADL